MQLETPVAKTHSSSGTRAIQIEGRSPSFGVPIQRPKMAERLPEHTVGRREFHLTLVTPPEYASLSVADRARLANGVEIAGAPHGRGMTRKDIGDMPNFQMEIAWPEAQAFRRTLRTTTGKTLDATDLHISLNGGIGDAIKARDAAPPPGQN